ARLVQHLATVWPARSPRVHGLKPAAAGHKEYNSKAKPDRQIWRRHLQSRVVDLSYCAPVVDDYAVKPAGYFRRFVCQTDQLRPCWPQLNPLDNSPIKLAAGLCLIAQQAHSHWCYSLGTQREPTAGYPMHTAQHPAVTQSPAGPLDRPAKAN